MTRTVADRGPPLTGHALGAHASRRPIPTSLSRRWGLFLCLRQENTTFRIISRYGRNYPELRDATQHVRRLTFLRSGVWTQLTRALTSGPPQNGRRGAGLGQGLIQRPDRGVIRGAQTHRWQDLLSTVGLRASGAHWLSAGGLLGPHCVFVCLLLRLLPSQECTGLSALSPRCHRAQSSPGT